MTASSHLILFVVTFVASVTGDVPLEHHNIISEDYNRAIMPPTEDGSPLELEISIQVNGIEDINTKRMSVKLQMYLRVSWVDKRLRYPYEDPDSVKNTSVSLNSNLLDKIWVPDHFFRQTREVKHFKLLQEFKGFKLFRSLRVLTSAMIQVEIGCPMNFRSFPFDQQTCLISLASYFHFTNEMTFQWHKRYLEIINEARTLPNYEANIVVGNTTVCECRGCVGDEPCVQFYLILKRYYLGHLLGFYIPSTLLMGISWSSFFWPADIIPGRTVLVITSLLAISSLYADSRQNSPKTSYIKALDAWMFFSIIIAVLTLFQYAVVLQWKRMRDSPNPVAVGAAGTKSPMCPKLLYKLYQEKTEKIGKYGIPALFIAYNLSYWPYVLTLNPKEPSG